MKFEGKTYKEISIETRYRQGSLEVYLSKKGKWYTEFESWTQEQFKEIQRENKDRLRKMATSATDTLIRLLSSKNDAIAFKVAQDILNRTGLENVELKNDPESVASLIWNRYKNKDKS